MTNGNYNPIITVEEALMRRTYENNGWDMVNVWAMEEGYSLPRIIPRSMTESENLGAPLTHALQFVLVEPHYDGTMNFRGVTWRYIKTFYVEPDPPATGLEGEVVTYALYENELEMLIWDDDLEEELDVVFIASGVRSALGAGGYSEYNTDTERSVTLNTEISSYINFYYTERKHLPEGEGYPLFVSTPEGIVEVMAYENRVTTYDMAGPSSEEIKFYTPDRNIHSIPLVYPEDADATSIYVETYSGTKSLAKYIPPRIHMLGRETQG